MNDDQGATNRAPGNDAGPLGDTVDRGATTTAYDAGGDVSGPTDDLKGATGSTAAGQGAVSSVVDNTQAVTSPTGSEEGAISNTPGIGQATMPGAAQGNVGVGTSVFDAGGETIGNLASYDEQGGRMVIRGGWLFASDTELPTDAVGDRGASGIYLKQYKADLLQQYGTDEDRANDQELYNRTAVAGASNVGATGQPNAGATGQPNAGATAQAGATSTTSATSGSPGTRATGGETMTFVAGEGETRSSDQAIGAGGATGSASTSASGTNQMGTAGVADTSTSTGQAGRSGQMGTIGSSATTETERSASGAATYTAQDEDIASNSVPEEQTGTSSTSTSSQGGNT